MSSPATSPPSLPLTAVAKKRGTYDGRLVRRLDFPLFDLLPIDATEERVVLDVAVARRSAAQPLRRVLCQQLKTTVIIIIIIIIGVPTHSPGRHQCRQATTENVERRFGGGSKRRRIMRRRMYFDIFD